MSEKKLNELNEMEAADGVFGERESLEGLLNDEAAADAVGGVVPKTANPMRITPAGIDPNLQTR